MNPEQLPVGTETASLSTGEQHYYLFLLKLGKKRL